MFAELGEVLNETKPALREKTTVFKSLGESTIAALEMSLDREISHIRRLAYLLEKSSTRVSVTD